MARHTDRDTARQELVRLLDGLDFYRAWVIASIEQARGEVTDEDLARIVVPASEFLDLFDAVNDRQMVDVLNDVRAWYAHTASDLAHMAGSGNKTWADDIRRFLQAFRHEVGFDFHAEAGLLASVAEKALTRGRITNDRDYDLLVELENDTSQAVVPAEDMARVSRLLRAHETRRTAS